MICLRPVALSHRKLSIQMDAADLIDLACLREASSAELSFLGKEPGRIARHCFNHSEARQGCSQNSERCVVRSQQSDLAAKQALLRGTVQGLARERRKQVARYQFP